MSQQAHITKELMKLSKPKLIKKCKLEHLPVNGSKLDMINRLINNKRKKHKNGSLIGNYLSFKSYTPTTEPVSTNTHHKIDKFQLKPTKVHHMLRKSKSVIINPSKSKRTITFGVGGNVFGEFGLNHTLTLTQLTNISKSKSIGKIFSGFQYTIYTDNKRKKYWSCGYNSQGQCGFGTFDEWSTVYKQIEYFQKHNILIKKICVNVGGNCTFWISHKNKIYGNGRNDLFQLGVGHKNNINKPKLIKSLSKISDIIDIQSAHSYSIALSCMDQAIRIIVRYWSVNNIIHSKCMPRDIMKLIIKYSENNTVYATCHSLYGGNGYVTAPNDDNDDDDDNDDNENKSSVTAIDNKWQRLEFFNDKKIIKIRTGSEHTLFLQDNGNVWCSGDNAFSQLGLSHGDDIEQITLVEWFTTNNIKIIDIRCGLYHNLALDETGKCYSWGLSKRGQCGHGDDVVDIECVETPQLLQYFVDNKLKIKQIECGNYHSFCKTRNGKYYLFGSNQHNQCLTFDGNSKVTLPHCINGIVKEKTKKKFIRGVYLGCNNTKIVVC